MLSLKARRIVLQYVKDPEQTFIQVAKHIGCSSTKVSKVINSKEGNAYLEQLQNDVAKRMNLSQKKQIKKLQKIYKKSMKLITDANGNRKPNNLASANQAISIINSMTGLDKEQKAKIQIDTSSIDYDDKNYAEKILMQIMGQYMERTLDKEDLDSLMKSLDTLAQYRLGSKVEESLDNLGVKTGSLFDRPAVINKKALSSEKESVT